MTSAYNLSQSFKDTIKRDKNRFFKNKVWLSRWAYQDYKRGKYPSNYLQSFYRYNGVSDLVKWFNFSNRKRNANLIPQNAADDLISTSQRYHKKLVKKLKLNLNLNDYKNIDINNAQDYFFVNLYNLPERFEVKTILDFGAGFGRQANIWTQKHKDLVFVGVDAIETPYCLQHLYYKYLGYKLNDYILKNKNFEIKKTRSIYHLPTWRFDLVPNSFFDLIICVQVMPELSAPLYKYVIGNFIRTLKPGGILYLRDHVEPYKKLHSYKTDDTLSKKGFHLEFMPYLEDKKDILGIPRIWRKPST